MGKRSVLQQFSLNDHLFGVLFASAKEITLFLSKEFLSQLFTKVTSNIRAYQNSRPDRPSFTSGHLTTSRSRKKEMELTQNKNCMNQSFHK